MASNPTPAERAAAEVLERMACDDFDAEARAVVAAVRPHLYRELADRQDAVEALLAEVAAERAAQDAKWGQQDHDLIDPILADRGPVRLAEEHEVPTEERAKFLCQIAAERGRVTWAHILVEEVAEVVAAGDDAARARAELVQVAAVAVAAIEAIDRRAGGAGR